MRRKRSINIILSLKKHHYVASVSIFLVALSLIAGIIGCGSPKYALVISSTSGGTVTDPGEGLFTYSEETVVNLVATPDAG